MQCLINKGFCLHLLINFLSHLRHFTLFIISSCIGLKLSYPKYDFNICFNASIYFYTSSIKKISL